LAETKQAWAARHDPIALPVTAYASDVHVQRSLHRDRWQVTDKHPHATRNFAWPDVFRYISMANPDYRVNWHNDSTAYEYIKTKCGLEVSHT
jgi:hypothetical protein